MVVRPPRIEHAGGVFHVVARGNERAAVFRGDRDRERFLEILSRVAERYRWRMLAYCLDPRRAHHHQNLAPEQATNQCVDRSLLVRHGTVPTTGRWTKKIGPDTSVSAHYVELDHARVGSLFVLTAETGRLARAASDDSERMIAMLPSLAG